MLWSQRKARAMSQTDLSQITKVPVSQISRLEHGKQAFKTEMLAKFGKVFGLPPFFFLMSEREWSQYLAGQGKL